MDSCHPYYGRGLVIKELRIQTVHVLYDSKLVTTGLVYK